MEAALTQALVSLAGVGAVAFIGVLYVRMKTQETQDNLRRQYVLTFPLDVSAEAVAAFLRSLSGLHKSGLARLHGLPTVSFEIEADQEGIRHRLFVPVKNASYIINELNSHLPGVKREEVRGGSFEKWDKAVELGLSTADVQLRTDQTETVVRTLLASMLPLKDNQKVLMQWVVTPAASVAPNPKDKAQQKKQSDHTFLAVGRLAARGEDRDDAGRLMNRMVLALSSVRQFGVSWVPRRVPHIVLERRVQLRSGVVTFPGLLNVSELSALIGYPVGKQSFPGLPQNASRQLAAHPMIATEGIVIGRSNFPGHERPIAIEPIERTKHLHIIGPTGTGKSTLIVNLVVQEMYAGYGGAVFDPKGDLIADILDRVPANRRDDVILVDPTDSQFPIGLNVLEGSNPYLVTDQIMAVFDGLFDIYRMARTSDILRSAILTLAMGSYALLDVVTLLSNSEAGKDFRHRVTHRLKDRGLRAFWESFEAMRPSELADATSPVLRRLRPFELRPSLRAMLSQQKSTFDMKDVISNNKILLLSLSKGQIGEETSALIASLMFTRLWQEIQTRSAIPSAERTPFFAHLDEFQNYMHTATSVSDVLAEARGYGFGLTLAHQNLGQLPPNLRDAVLANARSKIIFQATSPDATALARELAPYVTAQDLQNLAAYEVVTRLAAGGQVAPAATASTQPMPRPTGSSRAVREASRRQYGRPIAEVEAEMTERLQTRSKPTTRPSVGWEEAS